MKKVAYIASMMMLVFAACTKVETYSGEESRISFAVGSYVRQTKADDGGLLKELETIGATKKQFRSRAFLHADGMLDQIQNYFGDGVNILWGGTGEWAPGQDYYWPKSPNSYINFVSWYDFREMEGSLASDPAISVGYTYTTRGAASLTLTNRTIKANDDILIADVAWRQNGNLASKPPYGKDGVTAGVPTLFRHYLSRVKVNMRSLDPNNTQVTYEVTLQNARIEGLHHQGTLSLTNTDPGTPGTTPWTAASGTDYLWTAGGDASVVNLVSSDTTVPTTEDLAILDQRAFLPQALSDDVRLVFTYTVTVSSKSNGTVTVTSSESNIPATIVLNTVQNTSNVAIDGWLPNKSYTYTIVIDPVNKEILMQPTLSSDWTTDKVSATVE